MIPDDPITPILDNVARGIDAGVKAAKAFDDGGPAQHLPPHTDSGGREWSGERGMTLLDWFAGQALVCYLSSATAQEQLAAACHKANPDRKGDGRPTMDCILAKRAYWLAEAMVARKRAVESGAVEPFHTRPTNEGGAS